MILDELVGQPGEWLRGTGPESDIVISTRIRLARNLDGYPFPLRASAKQKAEIETLVQDVLCSQKLGRSLLYVSLPETSGLDRLFLTERHLISKEMANSEGDRAVAIGKKETLSIMVNEEDHLRLQVLRSGLQLAEAWEELDRLDTALGKLFRYAFSAQFGFCTACPTNVGTGMRVSVLLHLPALAMTKQIEKAFQALSRVNYSVRGLYGEGTQPSGNFFQISNQMTLGKAEGDIVEEMSSIVPEIIKFERACRQRLAADNRLELEDRIWRAYGTLRYARSITSEETMDLLSVIRLGINMSTIRDLDVKDVNELFIYTQPAHLQKLHKRQFSAAERDIARANYIRQRFSGPSADTSAN